MHEELPPTEDAPKPAHGVAKGSYTQRLQAMRSGQAPVSISKPRLFKRGKKAPKAATLPSTAAQPVVLPKRKRAPSDHPRPHKGAGLCPPCSCGCAMTRHATPWIVADLKAGACKNHPACSTYAAAKASNADKPALNPRLMEKVAKERFPRHKAADPVAKTVNDLQTSVDAGAKVTARDSAKAFRAADKPDLPRLVVSPPDAFPLPDDLKIRVVAKDHVAPERMKTILTEVTALANEIAGDGSSRLSNIAADLYNAATRLKNTLADILISRLKSA